MPSYIATKTRQSEPELGFLRIRTLICDVCGERFDIDHPADGANKKLAAKQADWLGTVLAYDHECQRAHPDKIALP
jgi:hypothetical protein